jgi:hypothetical protein
MLEHTFVRPSVIARLRRSPMGPYLDTLAASLRQEGYASSSTQRYLCAAEKFAQWLQEQGYAVCDMDEDLLQRYISGLPRYRSGKRPKAAEGLSTLLGFLHQQGVTRPRQDRLPPSPIDEWVSAYDAHLAQVIGLSLGTRQFYGSLVRRFITDCFGTEPPDWPSLTAARITTFVGQETAMRHNTGRQLPAVAVRSFLKFLVFRGEIRPGLEAAAPSPPQWKYASLPLRLTPQEVERVLPTADWLLNLQILTSGGYQYAPEPPHH